MFFHRLSFSWRCTLGAALFLLIYSASFSEAVAAGVTSPAAQVFRDSFLPKAARPEAAALQGTPLTEGEVKWSSTQGVAIGDKGATSSSPGGAHHLIDNSVPGTIHLHAEVDARGSGFTGIALGRGDLSGNFWANLSLLLYVSGDRYNLLVEAKDAIANVDKTVLHTDGLNTLDLSLNTVTRTVTAKINNKPVLSDFPLPASMRLTDITSAGFRFNEPVIAGKPSVSNYRAEVSTKSRIKLDPINVGTFFVAPNKTATLQWRVVKPEPSGSVAYVVRDYAGRQVKTGTGLLSSDGILTITEAFARGYSEFYFPSSD